MRTTMRTRPTRKTKTKIGSRRACLAACAALIATSFPTGAADKKKPEPYALIAGTIYRPPGFALPAAEIRIAAENAPPEMKLKKIKELTDARGEFAVRVPPVPVRYRVDVSAKGYQPATRTVAVETEDRYDLSIVLEPVPSNR